VTRETRITSYDLPAVTALGAASPEPPARRNRLVVIDGPDMGRHIALPEDGESITVGASTSCDLTLEDTKISARHAQLGRHGARSFTITDLGSTNGILFQGAVVREATLPVGATFVLGRTPLRVQPPARHLDLPPSPARRFGDLVGESVAIRELFAVLELAADSDVTVLVEGETGTGKELVARSLHDNGPRRRKPFVALDCGALSESLLESALFGHVRGAFTGAERDRKGAFRQAHGGTLFIDEVSNMSLAAQAKLLRVLESREVRPVGAETAHMVDVRVVAAANVDLEQRVADGFFRPDLFYRLAVVRLQIPPLRARPQDVIPIARALLHRRGFPADRFDGPVAAELAGHHWPGNVRELRNVLDRALALSPGAESVDDLRIAVGPPAPDTTVAARVDLPFKHARQRVLEGFEATYLKALLARFPDGNLSAMARAAELDRKTLRELLERHGLR